jgi:hypothetical protein
LTDEAITEKTYKKRRGQGQHAAPVGPVRHLPGAALDEAQDCLAPHMGETMKFFQQHLWYSFYQAACLKPEYGGIYDSDEAKYAREQCQVYFMKMECQRMWT